MFGDKTVSNIDRTENMDSAALLAKFPLDNQQVSRTEREKGLVDLKSLRALVALAARGVTRILSGNVYSQATAGASTIARYRLKRTAGGVLVDGHSFIENEVEQIFCPAGDANVDSYKISGADAELIAAAGYSVIARNVFLLNDGVGKEVAVFGAAALTGAQVAPTKAQIRACLAEVFGADWDAANGFISGEVLWQRKKVINYVVAGVVANAATFTIIINGHTYTYTATVPADDAAAVGAGLRALIAANEAGVTCGGADANVLLTATAAGTTFTSSSAASGAGTLVGTQADTMTETITDPTANAALLTERSAGSLLD